MLLAKHHKSKWQLNAHTCHNYQLRCIRIVTAQLLFVEVALLFILGTGNVAAQVALHYKLCKPRQLHMNLAEVLRAHLELPHAILPGPINYAKAAGELRTFMSVKQLPASCTLFSQVSLSCVLFGCFHL